MADSTIFENIHNVLLRIEEIKRTFGVSRTAVYRQFQERLHAEIQKMDALDGQAQKERAPEGQALEDVALEERALTESGNRGTGGTREAGNKLVDDIIEAASKKYRIPEELIRAVVKQESNFNRTAVSEKGAMGLMQLMPETADLLGVQDPFSADENIFGGARYLRELINIYGGNLNEALAAYNAGPRRVKEGVPDIPETKDFVESVLDYYERFTKSQDEEGF